MQTPSYIKRLDNDNDQFRFYQGIYQNPETQKEDVLWTYPSVTSKLGAVYPKDNYLMDWIRTQGMHGEMIFKKAGEDGTEIHILLDRLVKGETIPNINLSVKHQRCVTAFLDWYKTFRPKVLETEAMTFSHDTKTGGSFDIKVELDVTVKKEVYKGIYMIDYKTSSSLHDDQDIQVCEYAHMESTPNAMLLHLGNKTKAGWSIRTFNESEIVENHQKFLHFNKTFDMLYPDAHPNEETFATEFILPKLN